MKTKVLFSEKRSALFGLDRVLKGKAYQDSKFFIIVDENTYNHCLPTLISSVPALQNAEFFEVPVGEEAKSIEVAANLWQGLLECNADRNSVIVNLGGGCVSDIGGFVAAGYKRGIRYINVPTTLIGMVDAAIGGKTAVNMDDTKNQIGFFHLPDAICIHPEFLATLPINELVSGLFEMIKTMLLSDIALLEQFESSLCANSGIMLDPLMTHIKQCVDFKNAVVASDPVEKSVRKILNLGHTFGHAIESYMIEKGSPVSHGIAVGIGLKCELYLSVKKLGMNDKAYKSFCRMLAQLVNVPKFTLRDTERILTYMRQDKKNQDDLILCVLLQNIGVPVIDVAIDENEVRDTLLKAGKF